jgi:hypothetical protein
MGDAFVRCCDLWADATAIRTRQARQRADLPAMELHAALSSMGPDTDAAARVIILTASGEMAGASRLSVADVERLLSALGVPDYADVDIDDDADRMVADVEAFLAEGGA